MVTVSVSPFGTPTAVDDTDNTPYETLVNVDVMSNDAGPGIGLASVTSPATNAAGTSAGTVINTGTDLAYTPANGFWGDAYFHYVITNAVGAATGS